MNKQVTKRQPQQVELFVQDRPEWAGMGRGSEEVGISDISIPRVEIVQAQSPAKSKTKPQYIEGAKDGDLFNTSTRELYGPAIVFVPCYYRKEYIIWRRRQAGGGFRGAFMSLSEAEHALPEVMDRDHGEEDDYEIIDTNQQFGLVVTESRTLQEVVISMAKTKAAVSRKLNTLVRLNGGDRFSRAYKIGSVEVTNDQGTYYNFTADNLGWVPQAVYLAGEQMYNSIRGGVKDVNRDYTDVQPAGSDY